jgi:alkaline phosphatase D
MHHPQAPGLSARGIRARCAAALIALSAALPAFAAPDIAKEMPSLDTTITRIAFGSCSKETLPQPIWDAVLAREPDLFVFLGDNIYGDTRDMDVLRAKYAKLAAIDGVRRLRAEVPVIATWDDHDYGENDAGADYPMKEESRRIFLDFWGEPADSPRRDRDGVYTSYTFGPVGRRVQVILLDLRYNRTPIATSPILDEADGYKRWAERLEKAGREVPGPYARNADPAATMLGERQWRWLEEQLQQPADVRVIGSSLQVIADFPGWEAWVNYPNDQQRLFRLIRDTRANGVFMISGDTHYGELSRQGENVPYPLYDLTSSGLTEVWHAPVPNALRMDGRSFRQANFGMIEIDWDERALDLSLRDVRGEPLLRKRLRLDDLAVAQP